MSGFIKSLKAIIAIIKFDYKIRFKYANSVIISYTCVHIFIFDF